jgi:hypothetical protein
VHAHRIDIGAVEHGLVGGGVVGLDPLDQLVLAQEAARFGLGRIGFGLCRRGGRRRRVVREWVVRERDDLGGRLNYRKGFAVRAQ